MTERAYLDLLSDIMDNGVDREDRTGTGTRGVFGRQIRFDLSKGFPLLTTKKVFLRGIIEELLWFLRGSTNAKELEDKNVNIWKAWGDPETRELGPVYGKQWRKWESPEADRTTAITHDRGRVPAALISETDQIGDLIERLKTDPNSRRHMVVAWPCHHATACSSSSSSHCPRKKSTERILDIETRSLFWTARNIKRAARAWMRCPKQKVELRLSMILRHSVYRRRSCRVNSINGQPIFSSACHSISPAMRC
jgi:hypothetical protein